MTDAYVTDTHPLVFHAHGGKRLSKRARTLFARAEAQAAIVYVPTVVLWELAILVRIGRVDLGGSLRAFSADLFSNAAYQPCELAVEHVCQAQESALPNTDPFDGILCGVARDLGVPLITRDVALSGMSDLVTVW